MFNTVLAQRFAVDSALATILVLATTGTAIGAMCVAYPENQPAQSIEGLPPELANANMNILHSESFDDQPDFSAGKRMRCTNESDADCASVPDGWSHMYTGEKWHPVDDSDSSLRPSLEISGEQHYGSSGKSMIITDESYGSPSQWGSDGQLGRALDSEYKEIYAEIQLKFQPGFRWRGVEAGKGSDVAKIFRIAHFGGGSEGNRFQFFSGGDTGPAMLLDVKNITSSTRTQARIKSVVRCGPVSSNYSCGSYGDERESSLPGEPTFTESFGDGNWHKVAFRAKFNSAPGIADGEVDMWLDNILVHSLRDVPFIGTGSNAQGWNMFMVGGNMHNYPEDESQRFEQWWAIDDVRLYEIVSQ